MTEESQNSQAEQTKSSNDQPVSLEVQKIKDLEEIAAYKGDIRKLKKQIENQCNDVLPKINELNTKQTKLKTLHTKLEELETKATNSYNAVELNIKKISEAQIRFEASKTAAQTSSDNLNTQQTALKTKITEIESQYNSVKKLYEDLLKDKEDANGNKIASVKTNIEVLQKNLSKELTETKQRRIDIDKEFKELKDKLELRINSLLPTAGAAGLGYAYFDAKGRYGATPFKSDKENEKRVSHSLSKIAHFFRNYAATTFYYALFILPLIFISDLFLSLYLGKSFLINATATGIATAGAPADGIKDFFYRILITFPMGLISWFGYTSIRQNRRLYGEYDYKQRVMELYRSFKEEIEEEGTGDQKQTLLEIMLKTVADKPSLKSDKLPFETLLNVISSKKKIIPGIE